jgi:hypothetical protein
MEVDVDRRAAVFPFTYISKIFKTGHSFDVGRVSNPRPAIGRPLLPLVF